ncbi:MAG: hydrogenase expression protein HupH [Alphaproteobacteria bacterium]|nr:hydrogenase expression protein HupH [Alphaproteobacteria bacterium]
MARKTKTVARGRKRKILVLVPFPMSGENLAARREQSEKLDLGPDVEFHYRPVKWAGTNFVGPYDYVLGDFTILEAGLSAQDEGYDAVCIDTMSDSGVAALRAVLDIPVIGPGRATILTAMMLGDKFGMLVMWERWLGLYKKVMDELGVWHKYAGYQSIGIPPDRFSLLGGEEKVVFPKLLDAGKRLIDENKADVIILGSTSMHQAHGFLAERLPVPVISPGPLTYALAQMLLNLKLAQSRKTYPQPVARSDAYLHTMLDAAAAAARKGPKLVGAEGLKKGKK